MKRTSSCRLTLWIRNEQEKLIKIRLSFRCGGILLFALNQNFTTLLRIGILGIHKCYWLGKSRVRNLCSATWQFSFTFLEVSTSDLLSSHKCVRLVDLACTINIDIKYPRSARAWVQHSAAEPDQALVVFPPSSGNFVSRTFTILW